MKTRRAVALALALLGLLVGASSASSAATPDQRVAHAIAKGPGAVRALLSQAATHHDLSLEGALLRRAALTIHNDPGVHIAAYHPGCQGAISSEHTIHIGPVAISHQTVILDGFCWNGKRITSWGPVYAKRWSAFPYCWKDTSEGNYWSSYPKWRRAYVDGTLGGNTGFGCISLQHDSPYIDYANGGGHWKH